MIIRIVHSDDALIIAIKPAGMNFHSEDSQIGFFALLEAQLKESLYPVHRLDKMTSGLVIAARTLTAAQVLGQQFASHQIEKYYLAIVDSKPKKKQGTVRGDMQKSRRGMWKLTQSDNNPAVTQFFSTALGNGRRLFIAKPLSGKTHQIRVALKSLGAGIIGDPLYGSTKQADRGYLHAFALNFELNQKHYRFTVLPHEGMYFSDPIFTEKQLQFASPWALPWPKYKAAIGNESR